MTTRKRSQFQIDTSDAIRKRAKAVALDRGFDTLGEFVHDSLMKAHDPKLTKLIQEFLETKRKRGRSPTKK